MIELGADHLGDVLRLRVRLVEERIEGGADAGGQVDLDVAEVDVAVDRLAGDELLGFVEGERGAGHDRGVERGVEAAPDTVG